MGLSWGQQKSFGDGVGGGHTMGISLMPLDWMLKFNGMIDLMIKCRFYHSRNKTDTGSRETGLVILIKSTLLPKP